MPEEWYVPEEWRKQSTTNKQGSDGLLSYIPKQYCTGYCDVGKTAEEIAFDEYKHRLECGVSRELARMCLPQSTYTAVVWQMDIHNLMHFLRLRLDTHAQQEVRDYANAMYQLVRPKFPICFEAFETYVLKSYTITETDAKMLRDYVLKTGALGSPESYGIGKREYDEFLHKIDSIMQSN
jgi:thymidylate synthase (FAD)